MRASRLLTIGLLSAAFAVAAFVATSSHREWAYLGPVCAKNVTGDGFDVWTGMPHGRSYLCDYTDFGPTGEVPHFVQEDVPPDMVGRRAVPLPLGFLLGVALTLAGLALRRRLGPGTAGGTGRSGRPRRA